MKKLFSLLLLSILLVTGCGSKEEKGKENIEDKVVAPAETTEELVEQMEAIEVEKVNENEIVFASDIKLEVKQKVEVWVYSEPKFLGYFKRCYEKIRY